MNQERRKAARLRVNLPARWEGVLAQHHATITSLSIIGCFVLSGGTVEPKELIRLEIYLPGDEPVRLWGEVVDEAYEIGFAARFTAISDEDRVRLVRFIQSLSGSQ